MVKYTKWITDPEIAENTPNDDYYVKFFKKRKIALHKSKHKHIGPHEGKELGLLLSGHKPVGIIIIIPAAVKKKAKGSKLIVRPIKLFGDEKSIAIALPGEEWRIELIERLIKRHSEKKLGLIRFHIMFGRVLGYHKEQIRTFLENIR